MAKYSVDFIKIPSLQVGNSDLIFHVKQDEGNLGSLRISRGQIVWTPANKQYSYWLNWVDFGNIIVEKGHRRKAKY